MPANRPSALKSRLGRNVCAESLKRRDVVILGEARGPAVLQTPKIGLGGQEIGARFLVALVEKDFGGDAILAEQQAGGVEAEELQWVDIQTPSFQNLRLPPALPRQGMQFARECMTWQKSSGR